MATVLRTAYVSVEPDTDGFDVALKEQLRRKDPGGKAGKLVGSQLNAALRRATGDSTIDIKADPKQALIAIAAAEDRLKALARDSATVEVKVQTEKALLELRRFKKQLGDVGDVDAGGNFLKKFTTSLGTSFAEAGSSGPLLVGAGVLGAALAPTIGAAIGAGIAGGAGAASILGGIALVAKDPLVAAYGKQIGQRLLAGLTTQAEVFKKPLLDSLATLDAAAQRSLPKIGAAFQKQAPLVQGLTGSVTRAGEALLDSFVVASGRSAPALGALGHMIEAVGASVGGFIDDVTSNSAAGASALNDVTLALTNTLHATGMFIQGLADIKGGLDSFDSGIDKARYGFEDFTNKLFSGNSALDLTADGYSKGSQAAELYRKGIIGAAGSVNDFNAFQKAGASSTVAFTGATVAAVPSLKSFDERMRDATAATKALSDAIHSAFSDQLSLDQATLQLANGAKTLRDELTHGTRTLSLNSAEGRTNRGAVLQQLSAIESLRQARFAETGSTQQATGEYNKNVAALRRSMLQAGFTKSEVDALIGSYKKVPGKVNTAIGTPGLPQSDAGIKNYDKKLDDLARQINTKVSVTGVRDAESKLKSLLIDQQALKKGISVSAAASAFNKNAFASGGYTGAGSKYQPAGVVHAGEFVFSSEATSKIGVGNLNQMHQAARGYASGGPVLAAPFPVNAGVTRIPSRAEALAAVTPSVPSGGQTYKFLERVARAAFPDIGILSAFRPGARTLTGNQSYHAVGRAVDFSPSLPFAEWVNAKYFRQTKELITPWQSLNIRNGARHHYSALVENQHNFAGGNAHDHWAMANGGVIPEPVFGVGRSGRTYSFGERGPETVTPGAGGGDTFIINVNSPLATKQAAEDIVVDAIINAKRRKRIP